MSQPSNPLKREVQEVLPSIEVFIPCKAKDGMIVGAAIESTKIGIENPVSQIVIMAPFADHESLHHLVEDGVRLLSDDDQELFLTFNALEEIVPLESRGWIRQQILKLAYVARSKANGVLVLDSDTVLLQPRVWLEGRRQLLAVAHEYHLPYVSHARRCLGDYVAEEGVSWVTHHQLMQPRVVRAMLDIICQRSGVGRIGNAEGPLDVDQALEQWIRLGDFSESSAVSEYHTYGIFLRQTEFENAVLARWSNVSFSPSETNVEFHYIVHRFRSYLSASGHSYLRKT